MNIDQLKVQKKNRKLLKIYNKATTQHNLTVGLVLSIL